RAFHAPQIAWHAAGASISRSGRSRRSRRRICLFARFRFCLPAASAECSESAADADAARSGGGIAVSQKHVETVAVEDAGAALGWQGHPASVSDAGIAGGV